MFDSTLAQGSIVRCGDMETILKMGVLMKTQIASFAVALSLLDASTLPLSATVFNLGALSAAPTGTASYAFGDTIATAKKSTKSLSDSFDFSLSGPDYATVSFSSTGKPAVTGDTLSLVEVTGIHDITLANAPILLSGKSPEFAGISGSNPNDVLLGAGSYVIEATDTLKNTANSVGSTALDGTISVAAVPELSTWAMMVLGFAGIGLMYGGSKRRKAVAA